MPYDLAPRLFPKDIPEPCSTEVEAVLEIDRLFWLDPKNGRLKQFERALVPGEELPYKLPTGKDKNGIPFTVVLVQRWGRTFLSSGKPVLMLVDNPPPKEKHIKIKKAKKDHGIRNALEQFRRFMGEYVRQSQEHHSRSVERKPTSDERQAQSIRDKQRAEERRTARATLRAAVSAAKRKQQKDKCRVSHGDVPSS